VRKRTSPRKREGERDKQNEKEPNRKKKGKEPGKNQEKNLRKGTLAPLSNDKNSVKVDKKEWGTGRPGLEKMVVKKGSEPEGQKRPAGPREDGPVPQWGREENLEGRLPKDKGGTTGVLKNREKSPRPCLNHWDDDSKMGGSKARPTHEGFQKTERREKERGGTLQSLLGLNGGLVERKEEKKNFRSNQYQRHRIRFSQPGPELGRGEKKKRGHRAKNRTKAEKRFHAETEGSRHAGKRQKKYRRRGEETNRGAQGLRSSCYNLARAVNKGTAARRIKTQGLNE